MPVSATNEPMRAVADPCSSPSLDPLNTVCAASCRRFASLMATVPSSRPPSPATVVPANRSAASSMTTESSPTVCCEPRSAAAALRPTVDPACPAQAAEARLASATRKSKSALRIEPLAAEATIAACTRSRSTIGKQATSGSASRAAASAGPELANQIALPPRTTSRVVDSPTSVARPLPGGTTHTGSNRDSSFTRNQPTLAAPEWCAASSSVDSITSRMLREASRRMLAW